MPEMHASTRSARTMDALEELDARTLAPGIPPGLNTDPARAAPDPW